MADDMTGSIYRRACNIVLGSAFDYCKQRTKGKTLPDLNNINPLMFPWIIVEPKDISEQRDHSTPRIYEFDFRLAIICLSYANRGDIETVGFSDGTNTIKGVWDMVMDVKREVRKNYEDFGQEDVNGCKLLKWKFSETGEISYPEIRRMLINEYVDGKEVELTFTYKEDWKQSF